MLANIIQIVKKILHYAFWLSLFGLLAPRLITALFTQSKLTTIESATPTRVAIVFGAGLRRDGQATAVLRHRLETAVDLYRAGKVSVLLMSGHERETNVMRQYAMQNKVPEEAILLDQGGLRTYDTCYRAVHHFQLDSAILVTQAFHLPRALYLCRVMDLEVQGIAAHPGYYRRGAMVFWQVRETLATAVALWQVHISKPLPAFHQECMNAEVL